MAIDKSDRLHPYHFLAGVVSFGPSPCGLENWPGVYTVRNPIIGSVYAIAITCLSNFIENSFEHLFSSES